MSMISIRKFSSYLHLYLGLFSGIIVFIVALTGCIYVFQKDLYEFIHHDAVFISESAQKQMPLPLTKLKQIAESALNGKQTTFITIYKDKSRTWEFASYKTGDPKAFFYFAAIDYYLGVLINPYNGKVTLIRNYKYDFFNMVKYIHWNLLINHPLGQQIVGAGTLIFILLLLTGFILWLPKKFKRQAFKPKLMVKLNARFKRLNHDLHSVLGFYALIISLVIALTGIVWSYKWAENTIYFLLAQTRPITNKTYTSNYHMVNKLNKQNEAKTLELVFNRTKNQLPLAGRLAINLPTAKQGVIYVSGYPDDTVYYNSDDLVFDQYSGELLAAKLHTAKNKGEKLLSMNYDLHVGTMFGLPGKIIAFLASLIAASLPVTGFIFWLGKKKKH